MIYKILALIAISIVSLVTPPVSFAKTCGVFEQKVSDECIKFSVPSNAHLTYSGNSWDCNRGFKRTSDRESCEEIVIPSDAQANYIGSFNCNSGYRKLGNECQRVQKPENSQFFQNGADFYCTKGYQKSEDLKSCQKIKIPENAFADDSSLKGWNCYSGYLKEGDQCRKFDLPEHGFWFMNYWGCEPGFKKNFNPKSCDKISIPENAHATQTFDGWACNSGYTKNYRDNRCDRNK